MAGWSGYCVGQRRGETGRSESATAFQIHFEGGWQDLLSPNYSEPAGGWKWVTGEPWVYTNWYIGQPDNSGGREEYIRSNADWHWDDFPDNPINPSVQYISGYFVEYTVPEPGLLALGTFGIAGLMMRWRDKRGVTIDTR